MYRVGVFDSGVGGKSVANAIQLALPSVQVKYVNDSKNVPYGIKSPDQLFKLVLPILSKLAHSVDIMVIACNTVSTTLIDRLRQEIDIPLIAIEPMIKPAAELTKTGIVTICATPTTLASERYRQLKDIYAKDVTVQEPDCSGWALMIEADQLDRYRIFTQIDEACKSGADIIVLGCTHYHWIENIIKETADGRAEIIQPEKSVIKEVKRALARIA